VHIVYTPIDTQRPAPALLADKLCRLRVCSVAGSREAVPDFTAGLQSAEALSSSPMSGVRVGVIQQTMGEGVAAGVTAAVNGALQHMQQLGATVEEVSRLLLHTSRRCSKDVMASAVDDYKGVSLGFKVCALGGHPGAGTWQASVTQLPCSNLETSHPAAKPTC
jgi:Asp-tRNA(Asn)/Glu-tRNA(Gln) amidotransferase A subunit family amidase